MCNVFEVDLRNVQFLRFVLGFQTSKEQLQVSFGAVGFAMAARKQDAATFTNSCCHENAGWVLYVRGSLIHLLVACTADTALLIHQELMLHTRMYSAICADMCGYFIIFVTIIVYPCTIVYSSRPYVMYISQTTWCTILLRTNTMWCRAITQH